VVDEYRHPILGWILGHWTAMATLAGLLLLFAVLALMTHWWNRKDEAACRATYRRPGGPSTSSARR
jgi:hypothetical protein